MGKKEWYKYNIRAAIISVLSWEVLFWILLYQILNLLGVFNENMKGEKVEFLTPGYAWFLLIIPLLMFIFFSHLGQRNRFIDKLGGEKVVRTFLNPVSTLGAFTRFFLIRNALVFVILALMQPAFGNKKVQAQTSDVELVFAVDVSNSMNAQDMSGDVSRIEAAKRAMVQFVNQASAGKIGILVFAGSVYPQLPLTADKSAAKMYIEDLSTNIMSNQGTDIGAALRESSEFFTEDKVKKVVVLITDGEDHEGGLQSAYEALNESGIKLLILGLGSEKGALVPKSDTPGSGYLKDDLGRSVISKLNKGMIREIAKESGGAYHISNESFPIISDLLTQINSKNASNTVDLEFEVKENRYVWPLTLGLIFLMILFIWEIFKRNENSGVR
ncbi:MAG: VWA domain-containing protein [Brumimicrobium sp.]|nr:VWA domain-containing protein [Brumimicrobium sp.]